MVKRQNVIMFCNFVTFQRFNVSTFFWKEIKTLKRWPRFKKDSWSVTTIMVESMSLMGLVAIFISIAIFLSIGIMLLDSATSDCSTLTGYNSANPSASTDWAKSCVDNNTGVQNSWILISVILVVVASIIVLAVVKMF